MEDAGIVDPVLIPPVEAAGAPPPEPDPGAEVAGSPELPALDAAALSGLRASGMRWQGSAQDRASLGRVLPVDPRLSYESEPDARRGRFVQIRSGRPDHSEDLEAMPLAGAIPSGPGRFGYIAGVCSWGPRCEVLRWWRSGCASWWHCRSSRRMRCLRWPTDPRRCWGSSCSQAAHKLQCLAAHRRRDHRPDDRCRFGVPAGDPGVSTGRRLVQGGERESRIARRTAGRRRPDPGLHSDRHRVDCGRGGGSDLGDALARRRDGSRSVSP